MTKTSIETISGQLCTVIWHYPRTGKASEMPWRTMSGGYYSSHALYSDDPHESPLQALKHIATALPALSKNPKPSDARLLYRYMAEGIKPIDKCGNSKMQCDYGNAWFTKHPITHAIDSETGERIDVAIKESE